MPYKNEPELYRVWCDMRRRCYERNYPQYEDYGGRGITVCDAWLDFRTFERDMSPRPAGHSIDRIDNNKGYSPENCRWATRKEQQRNRRNAVWVTIDGTQYRVVELAEKSGVRHDVVVARAAAGLSLEEVMSPKRRIFTGGVQKAWRNSVAVRLARTHCPKGHEYSPENTYISKEGWRKCITCERAKIARRPSKKSA